MASPNRPGRWRSVDPTRALEFEEAWWVSGYRASHRPPQILPWEDHSFPLHSNGHPASDTHCEPGTVLCTSHTLLQLAPRVILWEKYCRHSHPAVEKWRHREVKQLPRAHRAERDHFCYPA